MKFKIMTNQKKLEIIGLGSLQSQDRTTYSIHIEYLENGIEFSTFLYVSKWRYDDVETNKQLRDLLHDELKKQKELKFEFDKGLETIED
tara:strand:+ start:379 stop:645 length:267 start_codon:yes stop_codon:yes gene_type:complete